MFHECSEVGAVIQAAAAGELDLGQILMAMPQHRGGPPNCPSNLSLPGAFPVHSPSSPSVVLRCCCRDQGLRIKGPFSHPAIKPQLVALLSAF